MLLEAGLSGVCCLVGTDAGEGREPCCSSGLLAQVVLMVTNPPAIAGDTRDSGWIPGLERSAGVQNGNLLQYACLENPMDKGSWPAPVHGAAESDKTD